MGMCCALQSVSNEHIDLILSDPPLIWRLIAPDDPEIYWTSIGVGKKPNIFARLLGAKETEPPAEVTTLQFSKGERVDDDLDKAWQGIHYCLHKTAYEAEPPLDFIIGGGKLVGDIDVGFGPARAFTGAEVKKIHQKLREITPEELRENYDPEEMENLDIYPNIWVRDGEEGFEYIEEYFKKLQQFIAHCVHYDLGMIVFLC